MHHGTLILFTIVLILVLNHVPQTAAKSVKQTKLPATTTSSTTTTTATTTTTTTALPLTTRLTGKARRKPKKSSKIIKKKRKKPRRKSKKPKKSPWKIPDADEKKLFNDYKIILRTKIQARGQNVSANYPLEPTKYASQPIHKSILHHYLVKLPDGKYAHAIIGTDKDGKRTIINEDSASIRRTIYDNLADAGV